MRPLVIMTLLLVTGCGGGGAKAPQLAPVPLDKAQAFAAAPVALSTEGLRAVAAPGSEAAIDALAAKESARWGAALEVARAGDEKAGGPGTIVPARGDGGYGARPALLRTAPVGGSLGIGAAGVQMVTLQGGFGKVANPGGEAGRLSGSRDGVGFTLDVDKAGTVALTIETKVDIAELFLSGGSKASIRGNTCPDPNGKVDYTVEIRIDGRGKSASYSRVATARVTAATDDDANIVEGNAEMVSEITSPSGKVVTAVGQQLGAGGAFGAMAVDVTSTGDVDEAATAQEGYGDISLLARGTLAAAEFYWKNGSCIAISADPPGKVEPGSSTTVQVAVTSTVGNGAVPAKVAIALSGKEKVDRTQIDKSPDSFVYTAPGDKDSAATIALKATSRQGRATRMLDASTAAEDLRLSGVPYGFGRFTSTKCGGPEGRWTAQVKASAGGSDVRIEMSFTLAAGTLTGPVSGTRIVSAGGVSFTFPVSGQARFDAAAKTLRVSTDGGGTVPMPVTVGSFCKGS